MISVSKPFLPPKDEYDQFVSRLWESKWLTNNGLFVRELEEKLRAQLNLRSLHYVSNGTIALQLAIKALNVSGDVITTPFSFVATTTSLLWENCRPVFVDINPETLCIDANKIEEAITPSTAAILVTHVFGIPCDVEKIESIAKKYNLKLIFDGAHAFAVNYKGRSLLSYGDISIISFHSTKLFHTVEGGAVINNSEKNLDERISQLRSFGFEEETFSLAGINGKNSEFHAAMGLCNLKYVNKIIQMRKKISHYYDELLEGKFQRPIIPKHTEYNYAYYPIIFETEAEVLYFQNKLRSEHIETRRYFYPSLNELPYLHEYYACPISESISRRILCLPLHNEVKMKDVEKIATLLMESKTEQLCII